MSMRRILLTLVLSLAASQSALAAPSAETLLKARILQLEMQLADAVRRINILTAQLGEVQQPALQQDQAKKRADLEKEAGCPLDWSVVPPACRPATPPEK
jgi:hypothetical protein